jgi:hypothetical protein
MSKITVKYDPTLTIESIEQPMYATSKNENEADYAEEVQQTKIDGILVPLVKVNNINIFWDKITKFELSSTGFLPQLTFTFKDDLDFTRSLDAPGNDNLVLVQILPPFDEAYKKINLRFFIENVKIVGQNVTIFAKYNVNNLYQSQLKAFGELSTYEYFDKIATECQLGYATNIDSTEDKRYRYIRNNTYLSSLETDIHFSGTDRCILDSWIDYHNYLILCDIYERYNANESDLKVWSSPSNIPDTETDSEPTPKEVDAILTNSINDRTSQLFISAYTIKNNAGKSIKSGTDKVLESYDMNKNENFSTLIQDGDIKKDTFIKSVYMGEMFGEYDYFLGNTCRTAYMQKINSNTVEVSLATPLLGLERGQRVNLKWYETNEITNKIKEQNQIETNIPDSEEDTTDGDLQTLNKQVSGQYLIIGTTIKFSGVSRGWNYILTLSRPADKINNYISNDK